MEHANTKENIREQDSLPDLFNQLIENEPKLVTNFAPADFITGYKKKTRLMELARDFKAADDEQKRILEKGHAALDIELCSANSAHRRAMLEVVTR